MIQGAPKEGKSVGIAALRLPDSSFAALLEAMIVFSRSSGSAMSVARLTSIIDTWLLRSVFPASRRLTGTAALSDVLGELVVFVEIAPQRARARCEHDIVDGAPARLGDLLHLGSATPSAPRTSADW